MIMRGREYAKRFTDEKLFHSLYETYQKYNHQNNCKKEI